MSNPKRHSPCQSVCFLRSVRILVQDDSSKKSVILFAWPPFYFFEVMVKDD